MSIQTRTPGARQFFSKHGMLSKWHPKYEFRAGQGQMAEAVEAALADKRHLIVEAGKGTGKTLGPWPGASPCDRERLRRCSRTLAANRRF